MPPSRSTSNENNQEKLFEYVTKRDQSENGFRNSIISMYENNTRWSNLIIRALVHALATFLKPPAGRPRYFFWGIKFEELILSLPKNEVCIVGGPKQLLFCLKNRRAFLPAMSLWSLLLKGLQHGPNCENDQHITSQVMVLSRRLRSIAASDAVFIVDNDSLPAQRAAIQAARFGNIRQSVCIQDGIFQKRSPGHILHGWFADLFFVIDKNQKNLLMGKGMPENKLRIMGFHSSPYLPKRSLSPPSCRRVCLIGQPWAKYDEVKGARYLLIFKNIYDILCDAGCDVAFKPHPWERGSAYLNKIPGVVDISMAEALENYDVFISLTSTALLEATLSSRIGIQIIDEIFESDRFSEYSAVLSMKYECLSFEKQLKAAVTRPSAISPIKIEPIEQRFLASVSDLT